MPELIKAYEEYKQSTATQSENLLKDLGEKLLKFFYRNNPDAVGWKYKDNWSGDIKAQELQSDLDTDTIFGISLNDFQQIEDEHAQLATHFLKTQKLSDYYSSFVKWTNSQISIAGEEFNRRMDTLDGRSLSENKFKGHVGI